LKNPITAILRSNALPGVKVIALSLLLVFVCAAPIMLYSLLGPEQGNPVVFSWIFALGALVAHMGFLIGILWVIRDLYFPRR
jgi:hypothetical protein